MARSFSTTLSPNSLVLIIFTPLPGLDSNPDSAALHPGYRAELEACYEQFYCELDRSLGEV